MGNLSKLVLPGIGEVIVADAEARERLDNLPVGLINKGTIGLDSTVATVTVLPKPEYAIIGYTYKVLDTADYYTEDDTEHENPISAKKNNYFICGTNNVDVSVDPYYEWILLDCGGSGEIFTDEETITLNPDEKLLAVEFVGLGQMFELRYGKDTISEVKITNPLACEVMVTDKVLFIYNSAESSWQVDGENINLEDYSVEVAPVELNDGINFTIINNVTRKGKSGIVKAPDTENTVLKSDGTWGTISYEDLTDTINFLTVEDLDSILV